MSLQMTNPIYNMYKGAIVHVYGDTMYVQINLWELDVLYVLYIGSVYKERINV